VEGVTSDVIRLHAGRPHNAVWPARHGPWSSSRSPSSAAALRKPPARAQFDTDAPACVPAQRGDLLRWRQLALQGQLELRVLHLPRRQRPRRTSSRNTAPVELPRRWSKRPLWRTGRSSKALGRQGSGPSEPVPQAVSAWWALLAKLPSAPCAATTSSRVANSLRRSGPLARNSRKTCALQVKGASDGNCRLGALGKARRWQHCASGPRAGCCGSICTPPATARHSA